QSFDLRQTWCEDNAENRTASTRSATRRCSIQISVGPHQQGAEWIRAVGALKQNERSENSVCCYPKKSALAKVGGTGVSIAAELGGAVEIAVVRLNQFGHGRLAIGEMKIEQGGQGAIGCDLENCSEISCGAPKARRAIEISIVGQDKSALRLRPVRAVKGE